MPQLRKPTLLVALLMAALWLPTAAVAASDATIQRLVHMLDYIGVDYPGAVRQGRVISPDEYREQQEFAAEVRRLVEGLPQGASDHRLATLAAELEGAIQARAAADEVARLARGLQQALLQAYSVSLAPRTVPDLEQGRRLYVQHCASCHGREGRGDGPLAATLPIAPSDFHDPDRQFRRSLLGYYNTISLGVGGTPMRAFAELDPKQRWSLAFLVGRWPFSPRQVREGKRLWEQGIGRDWIPDLKALVEARPADLLQAHGRQGLAILAWLRRQPQLLDGNDPLAVTRQRLARSLARYRSGHGRAAYEEALAAYLEGFELAEGGLRARDPELVRRIEGAMLSYREALREGGAAAAVEGDYRKLLVLLDQAQRVSSSAAGPGLAFTSALVILLREGMEALLLIVLIAVTVVRAGREQAMRYIHVGWVSALLAGGITWAVSNYLLEISGAGRELTEGLTALLATAVLLYVGLWLHDKTHASRWQHFLRERIHGSLDAGRVWLLTGVVFLAAYREVFETILFYQVLWLQSAGGERNAMLSGIAAAAALLMLAAWLLWRFSARLPLRLFFNVNAGLMFLLALIFAGKGVAALQEAGLLPATLLHLPRIDWLGLYPTAQGLILQGGILLFGLWWFLLRKGRTPPAAA